jgi:hypothetical protein
MWLRFRSRRRCRNTRRIRLQFYPKRYGFDRVCALDLAAVMLDSPIAFFRVDFRFFESPEGLSSSEEQKVEVREGGEGGEELDQQHHGDLQHALVGGWRSGTKGTCSKNINFFSQRFICHTFKT